MPQTEIGPDSCRVDSLWRSREAGADPETIHMPLFHDIPRKAETHRNAGLAEPAGALEAPRHVDLVEPFPIRFP